MKSAIPSDLLKLKKHFEAWRNTRAKRSKTPDRLLKAAAALLDHHSASMVCRVCGINLRTLRRRSSSKASTRRPAPPDPDFFPISITLPQPEVYSSPQPSQTNCRLLLERPDGAKLSIFLPSLTEASISTLWLCLRRFSRGTIRWWPNADNPLHALQAQELAVLLYNGLPDRADFADDWRRIDPTVFAQAARASASSSSSSRG